MLKAWPEHVKHRDSICGGQFANRRALKTDSSSNSIVSKAIYEKGEGGKTVF